ncbi:FecR domain-containing protein, partial [Stenotrophomonas pictorum]
MRQVRLGDHVLRDQRFETDDKGAVQILLADGSSFTVGPRSSLVIDSFVYDPAKGSARLAASASRGILRFVGGAASKAKGGVSITTPVGTAGIRGAVVDMLIGDRLRVDLVYGDRIDWTGNDGYSGNLSQAGTSMVVGTDGRATYPGDLPALSPGTVPDSPNPPMGDAGGLDGNPSGLAGFSGAPMAMDPADRSRTPEQAGGGSTPDSDELTLAATYGDIAAVPEPEPE